LNEEELKSDINLLKNNINAKIELILDRMKNLEIYFKLIEKNLVNYKINDINTINYIVLINVNYNIREIGPFNIIYLAELILNNN
jgi:hypothetical protein